MSAYVTFHAKRCQLVAGVFRESENSWNFPAFFPELSRKFPQPSCIFPATFSEVSAILPGSRNAFYSHNNQFLSILSWPSDKKKNANKTLKKLNCNFRRCKKLIDLKWELSYNETWSLLCFDDSDPVGTRASYNSPPF